MTFVCAFRASSATPRLMSSRTTQPLTSRSCSCSQLEISLARRSANERTGSAPAASSNEVTVLDDHVRTLFLTKTSFKALHKGSLRRHSEESTIFADVRSMMCLRAFTADGKKSEVSTFFAASLSIAWMSKPPARAGRKTPSTSKKSTLLRSSGGKNDKFLLSVSRCTASCFLASFAAISSNSGWGILAYRLSVVEASCAAFRAARSACCFFAASTLALMRCSRVSASLCNAFSASAASRFACSRRSLASRSFLSRSLASRSSFSFFFWASILACSSFFFLMVSSLSTSLSLST
mmetsp:Transcript_147915/g.368576  ORF Transcript_147915/g.368576 Transcript_147915/m.368576 type:complete len:294 (-) Transcript_147915:1041-1922(-)